jgi:GGDEF domain-containing protein
MSAILKSPQPKIFNFLKLREEERMSGNILEKNFNENIVIHQLVDIVNHEETSSNLWNKAYDPGALKTHKFINPLAKLAPNDFDPIIEEKSAIVFNRPAFTKKLLDNILKDDGTYNGTPFVLLMADIKGLEGANRIEDEFENKAADMMINSTVRSIASSIKNLTEFPQKPPGFCRYGGDEFGIFLVGNDCENTSKELMNTIPRNLAKEQGMYAGSNQNGEIYFRPIELKKDIEGNDLQIIRPPQNPLEIEIFIHFLKRSLILDANQINKVHNKFDRSEYTTIASFLTSKYPNSFYPEGVQTDEEKIAYIKTKNDFLAQELIKAKLYDIKTSTRKKSSTTFQTKLDFIECVVFDPLLKGIILQFSEIYDNLVDAKYSEILMLDVKFIKEINDDDEKGYVDADMVIINLWNNIQNTLTPEEMKSIDISRRGGTFIFGIKPDTANSAGIKINYL